MGFVKCVGVSWSFGVIIFEAADIGSDFKKWYEYSGGLRELSLNSHTERAFLAFAIFGALVSLAKIVFSLRYIYANTCGDNTKDEWWDNYHIVVAYLLFFEVIPQSILGWMTVDTCPPDKRDIWVDYFFAITCLVQCVPIAVYYALHLRKDTIHVVLHVVFWVLFTVGVVFAALQIDRLVKLDCF